MSPLGPFWALLGRNGWSWLRTGITKSTRCAVWVIPNDGFRCRVSGAVTQNEQRHNRFRVWRPESAVVTYREPHGKFFHESRTFLLTNVGMRRADARQGPWELGRVGARKAAGRLVEACRDAHQHRQPECGVVVYLPTTILHNATHHTQLKEQCQ